MKREARVFGIAQTSCRLLLLFFFRFVNQAIAIECDKKKVWMECAIWEPTFYSFKNSVFCERWMSQVQGFGSQNF